MSTSPTSMAPILVVDDEEDIRCAIEQTLEIREFTVETFARADRVLARISRSFGGVVVSDIRMPGMDGMALLQAIAAIDPDLPVILITGHGDIPLAVDALQNGAYDFIEKPFSPDLLAGSVARAAEKRKLVLENRALRETGPSAERLETVLIGRSAAMVRLRDQITAVAAAPIDVLIEGETGTGKELVARALHDLSDRAAGPFVTINIGALSPELAESELFGHVAHGLPQALRDRRGRFEHARGGTLFLDEIGAAPLALQIKLLRVLEDRAITPLGSEEVIPLDVRFVAATKENLPALVQDNRFRDDLLYRLNPVTLHIPSLRDHPEDAPRLFFHFVDQAAKRLRRDPPPIPEALMLEIATQDWPGNAREVRNAAERLVLGLTTETGDPEALTNLPLVDQVGLFEKKVIAASLAASDGNLKATYESLGLSRKTLYEKMQKYGLRREDFRSEDEV
ncbi:MAG: sigma-54-dependent transcriptional regulator [Rhodospirillaceae bacterium]